MEAVRPLQCQPSILKMKYVAFLLVLTTDRQHYVLKTEKKGKSLCPVQKLHGNTQENHKASHNRWIVTNKKLRMSTTRTERPIGNI
jgi:hypothetical protein